MGSCLVFGHLCDLPCTPPPGPAGATAGLLLASAVCPSAPTGPSCAFSARDQASLGGLRGSCVETAGLSVLPTHLLAPAGPRPRLLPGICLQPFRPGVLLPRTVPSLKSEGPSLQRPATASWPGSRPSPLSALSTSCGQTVSCLPASAGDTCSQCHSDWLVAGTCGLDLCNKPCKTQVFKIPIWS